jgi:hypothetical protein
LERVGSSVASLSQEGTPAVLVWSLALELTDIHLSCDPHFPNQ